MVENPPVLIIAYARAEGVRNLIEASIGNNVNRIYVAIDGPKNDKTAEKQEEIMKCIDFYRANSDATFIVIRRDENLGVGVGVISAIDWFFSQEMQGHILEDDLVVDSGFFQFSRICLERFAKNQNIYMISGTQLLESDYSRDLSSSNYPMIWGWSTWRDKWIQLREGLLSHKNYSFLGRNISTKNYWAVGANRVLDGKVDTWDTPLAAAFYSQKWICLLPPVNLVSNIGNDSDASHTTSDIFGLGVPIGILPQDIDFHFIDSPETTNSYNRFLENRVFQIKRRHILLPIYSYLFDRYKYGASRDTLNNRISMFAKIL